MEKVKDIKKAIFGKILVQMSFYYTHVKKKKQQFGGMFKNL